MGRHLPSRFSTGVLVSTTEGLQKKARARRSYNRAWRPRIVNCWLMGAMTATRANLCIRGLWCCASAPKPSLIATTVAD
jgi:hypothetical protein